MDRSEIRISGRIQSKRHAGVFLFRKDFSRMDFVTAVPAVHIFCYFKTANTSNILVFFLTMKGIYTTGICGF